MLFYSIKFPTLIVFSVSLLSGCLQSRTVAVDLPVPTADLDRTLWIALDASSGFGSSIVTLDDGRRAFLAFQADVILEVGPAGLSAARQYLNYQWQAVEAAGFSIERGNDGLSISLPSSDFVDRVRAVQWFTSSDSGQIAEKIMPT